MHQWEEGVEIVREGRKGVNKRERTKKTGGEWRKKRSREREREREREKEREGGRERSRA